VVVFLIVFSTIVFFKPNMFGYFLEDNNFIPADPLKTPPHIAPVWYFTPFYAILRAVPSFLGSQVWGVLAMGAAVVLIALLPWLDRAPVKSIRYRGPVFKTAIVLFLIAFIGLGILGTLPPTDIRTLVSRILSFIYFGFFIGMPFYTKADSYKPVPDRTTNATTQQKVRFFIYVAITLVLTALFAKVI
jgi:ubiquinol-cytochrome c reductase cytochrome b subunit